ncbi:porin [Massilia niastensis]|uniref:porin n=1 Tax=Massilia niastensis TaxID=544911 RepID=UPI00039F1E66|nr:porin [Massilia niastensis]
MKHPVSSAALAACAIAATMANASAQANVQIYGIVDGAAEYYDNADAAGHSLVRMPSLGGGMFPSRLGFKGSEDIGNGLKAVFTLENGFYLDSGSQGQGNRLFGRQAWVGLAGSWGQLSFGRNYNAIYQSSFDVDVFAASQYGLGSLDPAIPNGRSDNSIAYKGVFKGLTVAGTYSTGRDTSSAGGPAGTGCAGESAADSKQCREWSAMLRYDGAGWGVVGAYDRIHGGPAAAAGLNSSGLSDSRLHVAGFARAGAWKIGAGVLARDNEGALTQRSNLYYVGATWRAAPAFQVDAQVSKLDYRDSDNDARQLLVRGVYELSRRTAVYAAAGRIVNSGSSALALSAGGSVGPGLNQSGVITGIKHSF